MAKSAGCRPCKAFARKYQRISALYQDDAVFCVITGDESKETRAMMMAMKVRSKCWCSCFALSMKNFGGEKRELFFSLTLFSPRPRKKKTDFQKKKKLKVRVTPTFFVYRDGALFKTTTGVNENNLKAALDEALGGGGGSAAAAGATTEEAAAA
jgi:hypothetical protein